MDEAEAAYRAALDSAVRSLGQREHARRELERKLASRGHAAVVVRRVIDYLLEHDLQSDERFAEGFVRSRVRKGYGPVKIRQELASRGVDETALERQLTEPADYWLELARQVVARKFGDGPHADGGARSARESDDDAREAWNARARFLARRGFPADLIYRALGSDRD